MWTNSQVELVDIIFDKEWNLEGLADYVFKISSNVPRDFYPAFSPPSAKGLVLTHKKTLSVDLSLSPLYLPK